LHTEKEAVISYSSEEEKTGLLEKILSPISILRIFPSSHQIEKVILTYA
jgi:hypothetical protein